MKTEMNTVKVRKTEELEAEQLGAHIGEIVQLHGSIYKIRKMSSFAFVLLRTKRQMVQCVYEPAYARFALEELNEEACVRFTAEVIREERSRSGYDLHLLEVEILSEPEEVPPVVINQKRVNTSIENLLDYRPITLRNEKERAVFQIQARICQAFREFLDGQHFTEIHTPKLVAAGAEGGANIFSLSYFGEQAYLAQSPQFYKQAMVPVYERVFEIGPVFRAEKHNTQRHLNEYTSMDFEMGFIDGFEDVMQMETKVLQNIMAVMKADYAPQLAALHVALPDVTRIPAVRFDEAKRMVSEKYGRAIRDPFDLEPEEEQLISRLFAEEYGSEFVFVTHYPSKKRPFYAADDPEDPRYTLSFDLLFRGLEVTTGGQRIHDYDTQVAKMLKKGMNPEDFAGYLMIHKYGTCPHGGLGLGLERLTARLLGENNVRETCLFPRDQQRIEP